MGPRNSSALGNEAGLTCNYLVQGHGSHHTTSSMIYHDGTNTCIPNTLIGSTICTTMTNASCIGINTTTPFKRLTINTSGVASDGIAVSGDSSPAYIICETSGVGSTFTNDSAASYIGTITNHPFNVRSNSQNRLTFSNAGVACFACQVCTPSLTTTSVLCSTGGTNYFGNAILAYAPACDSILGGSILISGGYSVIRGGTDRSFNVDTYVNSSACVNALKIFNSGIACFGCTTCAPTLVAGSGGMRSSGNFIFPGNLTTRTIWNEGYGGAVQLRRSDADTDRYARIGIVNDTGVWVSGMTINGGTAWASFDAGVCAAQAVCAPAFIGGTVSGTTGTFSGNLAIGSASTNAIGIILRNGSGASRTAYLTQIGTNASSADITWYNGVNVFATDASFEIKNAAGNGLKLDTNAAATFSSTITGTTIYGSTAVCSAFGYFSGCVGIGNASPISMLTVNNGSNGNITSGFMMNMGSTNQGASAYGMVGINVYGGAGNSIYALRTGYNPQFIEFAWGDAMIFHTTTSTFTANNAITGTEKMRITNAGNVGIGTSSPQSSYKVTISGTDTIYPAIYLDNTTNGQAYSIRATGTNFVIRDNTSGNDKMTITNTGIACFACQVCAPSFTTNGGFYGCVFQGAVFSTISAGSGTGTASFDTITRTGNGLYEVAIMANPNAGGSNYIDFFYGRIIIGKGYSGIVTDFITWCQESPPPRCLYPSGGGGLTITACMYYSGAEYSCIGTNGSYTIRFKIAGYNSSYTGADTAIYLKSII